MDTGRLASAVEVEVAATVVAVEGTEDIAEQPHRFGESSARAWLEHIWSTVATVGYRSAPAEGRAQHAATTIMNPRLLGLLRTNLRTRCQREGGKRRQVAPPRR